MGRLIRVVWLCIAWLIAILSGASFFYGIENGLRELAFLSAGLALAALAASLVPLSRSFDSSFGVEPQRRTPASPTPPSQSGSAPPPAIFPTRAATVTSEAPAILHQAGSPIGEIQRCIHCGKVLADPSLGSRSWASSVWVVEVAGGIRSIDPVEAEAMDAQPCTSVPTIPEAWGAS